MSAAVQCKMIVCIDCKARVPRESSTQIRCTACRARAYVRAQTEYMDRKRAELAKTLPVVECTKCHEQKPCKSVKLSRKPQNVCLDCLRAMHSRKYKKQVELRVVTIQREVALEASGKKATPLNCYHRAKAGNCTHPSAPWCDCLIQRCKGLCAMGFRA